MAEELKEQIQPLTKCVCNHCQFGMNIDCTKEGGYNEHDCKDIGLIKGEMENIFKQAGYVPLQADDKGLAKNPFKDYQNTIPDLMASHEQLRHNDFEAGSKAQKALDDTKEAELVKKVFDWFEDCVNIGGLIINTRKDYESFKKQTLEELEK